MIRTSCLCLLLTILLAVTSLGHAQIEQRLHYYHGQEGVEKIGGFNMFFYDVVDPPGELQLPEFKAQDPVFFAWDTPSTKDGVVWFVVDRSSPDKPHDLLMVDSDCDGDLTDEQVLHPDMSKDEQWYVFRSVPLNFPDKDDSWLYHVNVEYRPSDSVLGIGPDCCYAGTITIGDREYETILKDNSFNGAFNRLSIAPRDMPDFRVLGRFFDLDETLYSLDVLEHGALIKLTPAPEVPMGQVQVPEGISYVRFVSELGTFCRVPKNGTVTLPHGTHHLSRWTIERKDKQGRQWRAEGRYFDEQGLVEVNATHIPSLKIGEPLLSSLTVNRYGMDLTFDQVLTGHMSETISFYVDGEKAEAPRLEVHDRTGILVDALNFEYG